MKHLCRISLTWAFVVVLLSGPKFLLQNKELTYKFNEQKAIQLHLENKKAELELLNKIQEGHTKPSASPQNKTEAKSLEVIRVKYF